MTNQRASYYLQQMNIQSWVLRKSSTIPSELDILAQQVSNCERCALSKTRSQTVFARGNPNASLMVIGEAPGFEEDKQGLPFVGPAGSLLSKMLASVGIASEDVFIANVLKCKPPNHRAPSSEEVMLCSSYLKQQIAIVAPTLILAVGHLAAQYLLEDSMSLDNMREKLHFYEGIPLLVTYHPASLLHNQRDKKKAYADLIRVKNQLLDAS